MQQAGANENDEPFTILFRSGDSHGRACVRGPGGDIEEPAGLSIAAGHAADLDTLRQWDATVDGMARTGDLVAVSRMSDASLEGHTHEYLAQHDAGIPVYGGGVSR